MQVLEIPQKEQDVSITDMTIDPSFRKVSKNSICFVIWKVTEDHIELVPKSDYGIFYNNCTYIIYAANIAGSFINQETITRELKSPTNIERYIHFWLGNKISPQNSGNVAYKVMELDGYFKHETTQFRETQENESSRFLSYFKSGIRIYCSTTEIKKDSSDKEFKLYQIKGKISPKCIEQEVINWSYFVSAYPMILKTTRTIFVWIGRSSSASEKRNALNIANKMRDECKISDVVIVDDGYEQSMTEIQKFDWNHCLPLKNRFVQETLPVEKRPEFSLKLYKCGYTSGKYRIEECIIEQPEQSDLKDSNTVYIIDACYFGVWIWIGKLAEKLEKSEAMRNARGFVKKKKYPSSTPVIKVVQNSEPVEFTRLFPKWVNNDCSSVSRFVSKLDSQTLFQRPKLAAETQLIDDGNGEKHIFRITDSRFNELRDDLSSVLFSNDCYLIHYITMFSDNILLNNNNNAGVKLIVYFWIGNLVSLESKKKCELSAKNYFENLDKQTMIVKIHQGYETPHFLQIFQGKLIVFNKPNDVPNHSDNILKIPKKYILKVYGDSTFNSKAFEVNEMIINSNEDRFVIKANDTIKIWCGQGSTGDQREVSKEIASVLGEYMLLIETKEQNEFLQTNNIEVQQKLDIKCPTNNFEIYDKFKCSLHISSINQDIYFSQEILNFDQTDLYPENIYFLDIGSILYVWIGSLCNNSERRLCWESAKNYIQSCVLKKNENITIAVIQQYGEPNTFVGYFETWDKKYWDSYATYDKMRKYVQTTNNDTIIINGENEFDKYQKFPLSILQQEVQNLPAGVDPKRKEVHLTHDDFVQLFEMKFSQFETLPQWKQQELKKKFKLF